MSERADAVAQYEAAFARTVGAGGALAFGHARHALVALLRALPLAPGSEILLSPLTCKVLPLALLAAGARPIYADVDPRTLNLDAEAVRRGVAASTKAILFQHTYGSSEGRPEVLAVAHAAGLPLIDDAAQVLAAAGVGGELRGTSGVIWSQNLRKPLPAGAGGMLTSDDRDLLERAARQREAFLAPSRGFLARLRLERFVQHRLLSPRSYWFFFRLAQRLSGTYTLRTRDEEIAAFVTAAPGRIGPMQARWGSAALAAAGSSAEIRRRRRGTYALALAGRKGLGAIDVGRTAPYFFPVLVDRKKELLAAAEKRGLEVVAWPIEQVIYPLERAEDLATYGYRPGTCPRAEDLARRLVGLPLDPNSTDADVLAVIELVRSVQGGDA